MFFLTFPLFARNLVRNVCIAGIVFLFGKCSTGPEISSEEFIQVISRSNFIFSGTVTHKDSSNLNIYVTGRMAIVRVDSIIDAVNPFYREKGKEITVLFQDSNFVYTDGQQLMFYTTGWYYGKSLGVIEVSNKFRSFFVTDKSKILKTREIIDDRLLVTQLKKADLIVKGKVLEINSDTSKMFIFKSEHNPLLKSALIGVSSVLKGDKKIKNVLFYYASSEDVMWLNSPKLSKNMEAIFLLDRGQENSIINQKEYTLLGPQDLQSLNQALRISKLLKK